MPRKTLPLSDICSRITSGGTPSRSHPEYYSSGADGHVWIKSKELLDCSLAGSEERISDLGLQKSSAKYVEVGSVLVGMYGANVGQLGWLKSPATVNQAVCSLTPNPQVANHRWLFYALLKGREELVSLAHGAAQQNISQEIIKKFEIEVPDLQEQQKVVVILSAYDDLIENNTRRIEILEEMARRLYEEWFVQFRFPGHEGVEFKESELGLIPKSWSVVKLEEICDLITDGAHKSPPTAETGMPMASVKDMHDWGVDVSKCRKISRSDYDELVRSNCKPMIGDVLVAKDGSYLKHIFSVEKDQDLVLLSSIAILRPINKSVSDLLVCLLRHPETIARMKGCVSGVAIPRIILKDFRKFQIVFPSQDLQEAWLATASPLMRLCRKLVDKNANLRAQRDLLLPKLISGEIDVSDIPMPT
ncbi:restriction endonuclease subunit S [Metapseudomonas otitidis]|uniref:restriction endonuclease subunit S n=1 Tax=Metapseudomonas otitidis TaxID=319939 RepID=UPI0032170009